MTSVPPINTGWPGVTLAINTCRPFAGGGSKSNLIVGS
ncbi:hypothetical protein LTSEADE_6033 [Salmonella enterica subsp. enterica serovar Adelaide str. A4-669]|uniref:Uncharacterized protein n=1 Tax=Salmonella enterica subsp. enterica serovar Adelaide str. A4-669 TaxID=913063 RepID=A0A6C8GF60_SALET|nr:hypothetical protein LTSEADE_6033 [Salmonella enterica subsp. enterica serovar Adelaide str. A4-669]